MLNTVRASLFKGPSVYWWELEAILPVSAASDPSPVGAGLGSRSPVGAAVAARRCMVRIKKPGLTLVCDAGIARYNFSAKKRLRSFWANCYKHFRHAISSGSGESTIWAAVSNALEARDRGLVRGKTAAYAAGVLNRTFGRSSSSEGGLFPTPAQA